MLKIAEVAPRYLAGEPTPRLAAAFGVSRWAIIKCLWRHGIPRRKPGRIPRPRAPSPPRPPAPPPFLRRRCGRCAALTEWPAAACANGHDLTEVRHAS